MSKLGQKNAQDVMIVSAARTAFGTFGRSLKDVQSVDLAVAVINEAAKRAGIEKKDVDDVILGNVYVHGSEPNVGRIAALKAGFPAEVTGMTVQRACTSGMTAVAIGAMTIQTGHGDIIIAGGTDSMSNVEYRLQNARWGLRMRNQIIFDALALEDLPIGPGMGITAENVAEKFNITREQADEHAGNSHAKALKAIAEGRLKEEIVPFSVPQRKGPPKIFDTDEHPRPGVTVESLAKLPPAFKKDGIVTVGNSSGINDGAAAMVLMTREKAEKMGAKPLAKLVDWAVAGVPPEIMGYGPVPATRKLLKRCDLPLNTFDLIEINEAFSTQYLTCEKELGLNPEITNVDGGAIAYGHPLAASASRICTHAIYELKRRGQKYGLCAICIALGMGMAWIVEIE